MTHIAVKRFSMLSLLFVVTIPALATSFSSNLNPEAMGSMIAKRFLTNHSVEEFRARQSVAQATRSDILNKSPVTMTQIAHMNFVSRKVAEESALAAIPMIDPSQLRSQSANQYSLAEILFQEYADQSSAPVDRKDLYVKVVALNQAFKNLSVPIPLDDEYLLRIRQTLMLANPIVEWLLQQPIGSVKHQDLLDVATMIFKNDAVTAVGVIGELFYQETLAVRKLRNREAVLASKMVPLVPEDSRYKVGHNYHFWRIITASLYRGGTKLGRAYGYIDNPIESYRFANTLGFDTADAVLARLNP